MDSRAVQGPDPPDQQVMVAQVTPAFPQTAENLEGESAGPNYGAPPLQEGARASQLPNGVPPRLPVGSPTGVEIESLPYTPMAATTMGGLMATDRPAAAPASTPAFFQEAWPAQPEAHGGGRGTALAWMSRLGDFLKNQMQGMQGAVETRTTLTRQQLVGPQGPEGGMLLRHEQLQHTTSQPASPNYGSHSGAVPQRDGAQSSDPPLFGQGARRIMDAWPTRAPLLHGSPVDRAGTDADSSGSIPKELVQEEVRRQVHHALENQRKALEDLKLENERLRMDAMRAVQGQGDGGRLLEVSDVRDGAFQTASAGLGVPGVNPQHASAGLGVPGVNPPQASAGLGVPGVNPQHASAGLGVPGVNPPQASAGLGVPGVNPPQASAGLGVPGVNPRQASAGLGVPGVNPPQASAGLGVPSVNPQQAPAGFGVPGRDDYRSQLWGREEAYTDEEVVLSQREGRRGRAEVLGSVIRGASLDRRSSPLERQAKLSPSPPRTRTGFRGSLRSDVGELGPVLPDGDGYGYPRGERAYRQPQYRESRTFGDYELAAPPGLDPSGTSAAQQEASQGGSVPAAAGAHEEKKEPSPLDILITGMTQLQQVLLKKNEVMDLETKGTTELPKLGEYNPENGAIEFQDFLYLVEQQIGSLASGAGEWWQKTLEVSQAAYLEYQGLSPVKRLGVKAQLTPELKDEKYRRLEKKVAAMLLSALPKGVKDDLIAYRVQGVHQILYRLMVIFQPGGAQDRAQILRQLDVSESASGPPEAVLAIRRWYRLLQRASDLGVTLPDESIQVRSLSAIVRKTSEQNADFKFRLALARTELQIDTRPNQQNVLKYMQHLLAELEQLGSATKKAITTTTTPTSTATSTTTPSAPTALKGLQGADAAAKAGAKPKAAPVGDGKKMCQWFGTDNGCRNGRSCTFQHSWTGLSRAERCLLCGSKRHRAKECTNNKDGSSPERGGPQRPTKSGTTPAASTGSASLAAASVAEESAAPTAVPQASSSSTTTTNKMDATKVTEILNETNKMLKALTANQAAATEPSPSSLDPIEMIQKQLDEVRRLKVLRVREFQEPSSAFSSAVSWYEARLSSSTVTGPLRSESEEALLDSGASHAYRAPLSEGELEAARRVGVALATGEERVIPQNSGGTLLSEGGCDGTILPMGQLVKLLGCKVLWTPSKLTVVHPVHGRLQVRLRGHCPVLPISQALELIAELEQKRVTSFERTVQELQQQIKVIRENGLQAWTWRQHLQAAREGGDRTHVAGFLHKNPVFSTVNAEVLLGIPEQVPVDAKDGWKLLKGTPWSRAKRKALFQSNNWVLHLFAGEEKSGEAKRRATMKGSFWSEALSGDEVMVEVDVTSSKGLDLLQRDGIFRVLAWAALNGRIKSVIGGPPRQTFPTASQKCVPGSQHVKESQLIVRMMTLFYMAEEGRTALWRAGRLRSMVKPHVGFLLEHPDEQKGELMSFFQTPLWKSFAWDNLMGEVPVTMNGKGVVLGGNMDLWHLHGAQLGSEGNGLGSVWPMELIAHVAYALKAWVGLRNHEGLLSSLTRRSWLQSWEPVELNKFDAKDWRLHVQRDHLPYRRDCRECVERASGKPHRRLHHPSPCVLSVDTAGPFRAKGAGGYRYLLVGCYRHPKLKGTNPEDEKKPHVAPEEILPRPSDDLDWILEDDDEGGVGEVPPPEPEQEEEELSPTDKEIEELKDLAKPVEFVSIYLARPLRTRKKAEALWAIQEMYIQLRSSGFPLNRLHMDRAREFQSGALEHWAAARDVDLSRTQGSDPAQNGTAERAVGYAKMRMRILLAQAKELSGLEDDVVKSWWPMAADTAVTQQQSMAMGRKFPSAARFGSRVFTKRKGYGTGSPGDLKPKWIGGYYLGPARSVPGGHMVYTDEGNLWFTTSIRQFEDREAEAESSAVPPAPDLLPARRVKGKTRAVELASGAGLLPGASDGPKGIVSEKSALGAMAALTQFVSDSEDEHESLNVVSEDPVLCEVHQLSTSSTTSAFVGPKGLAGEFKDYGRFTMDDCLAVLEAEPFVKTRKHRQSAWKENAPPPVHTTLGAYQRGPFVGITNGTARHEDLVRYLTEFMKLHSDDNCSFTSLTVARDLCTGIHSDRFNLRNSKNYVLTLGDFQGGGIWQEGRSGDHSKVAVESASGAILQGFVLPVKERIVEVDPKRLHRTMPWTGGPKWTVIAHTVGAAHKLPEDEVQRLRSLGFPLRPVELNSLSTSGSEHEDFYPVESLVGDLWQHSVSSLEFEEEMMDRLWMRRVLDEEEQLAGVVPGDLRMEFEGVQQANSDAAEVLHLRETRGLCDRYDEEQWLGLCRMTETEEETFGVETMLEELKEPLKVVFTVALDEVKNYAGRWSEAMHKEVKALLDAGALVPLSPSEQAELEASGKLVVLPAKGVFTAKPPDLERTQDELGNPLPQGSPLFVKRKARLVICGNFQGRQAREDSYAGGCQIDSLRAMLVLAARRGWKLASTDIRNAFILAPIKEEDEEDDGIIYALFPPKVFQLVVVPYCYQLWRVDRALYGFRRSPRLWSKFRDKRLLSAKIPFGQGHLMLKQSKADANVWAVTYVGPQENVEVRAYLNIYVDDVLYAGNPDEILAVHKWLTSEWKASELSWATEESIIRFLGLEIGVTKGGVRIGQQAYVDELVRHHKLQNSKGHATPCPQEWLLGECDEEVREYSPAQLKRAQVLTGELLWLSGRSRPDIMHSVATMSSLCVKNPELVERIGLRVLGYLKNTAAVCLWYKPELDKYDVLGYSDASFAPQGSRSVGCSVACYMNCPVSWRCGRQSLVALSVAEAELLEAVNCVQLMLGLSSFVEELQASKPLHGLRVDNQAAVGLTTESVGTWKTRHLRVRAFALREAVRTGELNISHVEGLRQLGDLGTKCFHRPRLEQLRDLWGLKEREEAQLNQDKASLASMTTSSGSVAMMNGVPGVVARLALILGWLVQGTRASRPSEGLEVSIAWELYGVALLCVIAAIALWEAVKWLLEWASLMRRGSVEEVRGVRRLRRLQQAVQEEVARYGLDEPVDSHEPSTPMQGSGSTSSTTLRSSSSMSFPFRSRSEHVSRRRTTAEAVVQTEPTDDGYFQFSGPFVMSEHGDRVHYHAGCHGLRNALTRRRQVTLCHYCERHQRLYQFNG